MYKAEELNNLISTAIRGISMNEAPAELYEPISYTLSLGGKRMRPVLTLMACDLFGGKVQNTINAAIGIEIFHNFTLLHDDIMDQAPLRRGQPTVHEKWDQNVAILSGDTMFALAYRHVALTSADHLPQVLKGFTETAIQVCEGQQMDMNYAQSGRVTIPEYLEMIRMKTAVLLACSLKTGAIIAGADAADSDRIYTFGEKIGMAFQLRDDLLDAFGENKKFGKITGGDIAANKKTYLFLRALEMADDETRKSLLGFYKSGYPDRGKKISGVIHIFREMGIQEETSRVIHEYYNSALTLLESVSVPAGRKEILLEYTAGLMERDS
ncbi:MAG: polyprenyl synthetase family protein [Bacteroidales bacterium]|nr:polyprenyl synthetase family protein [Bacteroidales bacterium]